MSIALEREHSAQASKRKRLGSAADHAGPKYVDALSLYANAAALPE
jgi:hypothetical protein